MSADPDVACHTRAVIAHPCSTATWQALRDEAGLTGAQARAAVAHAIRTLMAATTNPEQRDRR